MINYEFLELFNEIAIVFSANYSSKIEFIFDECKFKFPNKDIYLISGKDIICAIKTDEYESYIIVGIECPLHRFRNAVYYKEVGDIFKEDIQSFKGKIALDSIYVDYRLETDQSIIEPLGIDKQSIIEPRNIDKQSIIESQNIDKRSIIKSQNIENQNMLIITKNQQILDYYNYNYENISCPSNELIIKDKIAYLMKENINGSVINTKKVFAIIFTNKCFRQIVDNLYNKINERARAYKIYLKDISYERLISIDNIDCIVLVDCPVFQCNIKVHVPIISPFSIESGLGSVWMSEYDRNFVKEKDGGQLVIQSHLSEIMGAREFKGVQYRNAEEDMNMHVGRKGTASKYENEGE